VKARSRPTRERNGRREPEFQSERWYATERSLEFLSKREGFGEDGNISQAFLIECQRLHEVPIPGWHSWSQAEVFIGINSVFFDVGRGSSAPLRPFTR
jgi:hypothetical protein